MNIYVDIDETICYYVNKREYPLAMPDTKAIAKINKLYDEGHTINYWSARGTVTGIDWYEVTKSQLDNWGCRYHKLITGKKPAYDLLICDKAKRIEEI